MKIVNLVSFKFNKEWNPPFSFPFGCSDLKKKRRNSKMRKFKMKLYVAESELDCQKLGGDLLERDDLVPSAFLKDEYINLYDNFIRRGQKTRIVYLNCVAIQILVIVTMVHTERIILVLLYSVLPIHKQKERSLKVETVSCFSVSQKARDSNGQDLQKMFKQPSMPVCPNVVLAVETLPWKLRLISCLFMETAFHMEKLKSSSFAEYEVLYGPDHKLIKNKFSDLVPAKISALQGH